MSKQTKGPKSRASTPSTGEGQFDAAYVKKLRAENAKWRKQAKESQATAEPTTTTAAPVAAPQAPSVPEAFKPATNTAPAGSRTLKEMKADPIARSRVRDWYREKLSEGRASI